MCVSKVVFYKSEEDSIKKLVMGQANRKDGGYTTSTKQNGLPSCLIRASGKMTQMDTMTIR